MKISKSSAPQKIITLGWQKILVKKKVENLKLSTNLLMCWLFVVISKFMTFCYISRHVMLGVINNSETVSRLAIKKNFFNPENCSQCLEYNLSLPKI